MKTENIISDFREVTAKFTFVEGAHAFVLNDAAEAVGGALVQALLHRLLGLHLEAAADGVERVCGGGRAEDGCLGGAESRDHAHDAEVVLVRVEADDGVEGAELDATVPIDVAK